MLLRSVKKLLRILWSMLQIHVLHKCILSDLLYVSWNYVLHLKSLHVQSSCMCLHQTCIRAGILASVSFAHEADQDPLSVFLSGLHVLTSSRIRKHWWLRVSISSRGDLPHNQAHTSANIIKLSKHKSAQRTCHPKQRFTNNNH